MPRVSIRVKLATALAAPLLVLTALGLVEVRQSAQRAAEVRRQSDLARAVVGPTGLITTLQNERTWAAVELVGVQELAGLPVEGYDETRRQTDAALRGFLAGENQRDPTVTAAFAPAVARLDRLRDIRTGIDAYDGPHDTSTKALAVASTAFIDYSDVIEPFFDAMTLVSAEVNADEELRRRVRLAEASARLAEYTARLLQTTARAAFLSEGGLDRPEELQEIATLQQAFDNQVRVIREPGRTAESLARRWFPETLEEQVHDGVGAALATGRTDISQLTQTPPIAPYQDAARQAVVDRAAEVEAAAAREQRVLLVGLGLVALVATGITAMAARSVTRPLQLLTGRARLVAERSLPDSVRQVLATPLGDDVVLPPPPSLDTAGRDEVADITRAIAAAQDAALNLAVEQAVLRRNIADSMVSLSRRNQNLIVRQIDLITALEAKETDPDRLGALFHLDHLATRMRRNAESLVLLAGVGLPRLAGRPVAVLDVLRAVAGEVEDYRRAIVHRVEPAFVDGATVFDVVHILAELVENALTFSSPETVVQLDGTVLDDGGYRVTVLDDGWGMSIAEIERANARLSGCEDFTVAPSSYLGHFVAGTLAARHGIGLWLAPARGAGIEATVVLPPTVISSPDGLRPAGAALAAPPIRR